MIRKHFRVLITLLWALLLAVLFTRNFFVPKIMNHEITLLERAQQERFYGIWFENNRIGYVAEELAPREGGFELKQNAYLLLNILETTQSITLQLEAILSEGLVLQQFDFQFNSAFYTMSANGHVKNNTVYFQLDTGQSTLKDSVTLSGPPLLAVNDRSYLLKELSETGQKIRIPSFDPVSLGGRESIITYHGREKLLISKRLKSLHRFSEVTDTVRINFWLDDSGKIVKEESPAGFQFIAEPEFRAKDIVGPGKEILNAVAVKPSGPFPSEDATFVRYKVTYPSDLELDVQGGRQEIINDTLIISREDFSELTGIPENESCKDSLYLEPSRYVQSDNEKIRKLARKIVGDETDPFIQVRLMASWVYTNIEKRPVLGLPDALTTLENRKGDCNEHASLFAALARSLNIKTAIVTGVTLQNNAFYYHAWNEVCLAGKWYSMDTTTNQLPADLYHIRFGRGDMAEQLKIGGLIGKLKIEFLPE